TSRNRSRAMRHIALWGVLSAFCLCGNEQGQTEAAVCGDTCIARGSAQQVARSGQTSAIANLANRATVGHCPGLRVDVIAATENELRVACSATSDAIRLLNRCRIWLHRSLHVHIVSEARHPLSDGMFGVFDAKQDRVLVSQEPKMAALVKGTPYARLPP